MTTNIPPVCDSLENDRHLTWWFYHRSRKLTCECITYDSVARSCTTLSMGLTRSKGWDRCVFWVYKLLPTCRNLLHSRSQTQTSTHPHNPQNSFKNNFYHLNMTSYEVALTFFWMHRYFADADVSFRKATKSSTGPSEVRMKNGIILVEVVSWHNY